MRKKITFSVYQLKETSLNNLQWPYIHPNYRSLKKEFVDLTSRTPSRHPSILTLVPLLYCRGVKRNLTRLVTKIDLVYSTTTDKCRVAHD